MPFGSSVLQVPPPIANLVQEGLLERAFHDGLYPALQFRSEALYEEWEGNVGTEMWMTRPGLLTPVTTPLAAGKDPSPETPIVEQWRAQVDRYAGRIDTHMPTSAVANSNLFLRNVHQLGLQAGQSFNRLPRNALFKSYLQGQTVTTAAALAAATTIHVASANGFTSVMVVGTDARPQPVSAAHPLPVTIPVIGVRNVIGVSYDDPTDVYGPATLTLSAALGGGGIAARTSIVSTYAPFVIRTGGGTSVDAISTADTAVLQDFINAAAYLAGHNVAPHDDGFYHAHISPLVNAQVFTDPVMQRLNTALPQGVMYSKGFIGQIARILFFENTETPTQRNSGALTLTGTNAFYAKDMGAEVINDTSVPISRTIVTGKGALMEYGLDESKYISEAGINGKIGEFSIVNNSAQVMIERVRLILAAPIDALQDMVRASWSATVGFPTPTDATATTGSQLYKRAVVIESAGA
jgi:hypothetical protein